MTRLLAVVAGICLVLLAAEAPAAPVPDAVKEPVLFFPVARVTWTYQYHEPGDRVGVEVVEFVRSVTEAGGETLVALGSVHDGEARPSSLVVAVSGRGVVEGGRPGSAPFRPHRTLLRCPAVPGDRWVVPAPAPGYPEERYETRGAERVEVPGGRFDAVRVDTTSVWREGGTRVDRNWYAPNVGLVRWEDGLGRSMVLKRVARRH